jgi:heme-degrading monooxygenase HmoA
MVVQIVRFKSGLPEEEVIKTCEDRAPDYRAQDGLIQKYYLKYSGTNEYGAVYIWDSQDALDAFNKSELRKTIPEAYQVQGAPDIGTAEVIMTLRSE